MTDAGAVRVEDRGPVRVLTLDRPERRNALDLADRVDLLEALRSAEDAARAVVLTGAGPVFSAGGDIRSMSQDRDVARQRLEVVNAVARQLVTGDLPVVAAVEGGAYGLGLALAVRLAALSTPMVGGVRRILTQPDQSLEGVLAAEVQVGLLAGPQFAEGRAAFLAKRRPDFVAV